MIFENTDLQKTRRRWLGRTRQYHDLAELVRLRGHLLTDGEKALVTLILQGSTSLAAISRLTGLSKSTISRRFHRITNKLSSCRHPVPAPTTTQLDDLICREYFQRNRSQEQIAARLDISRYRVRKALTAARHRRKQALRRA